MFSQFWKLEVQDPSIGRIHSEASLLGLQMALFSLCLHMVIPLCGSVSNSFPFLTLIFTDITEKHCNIRSVKISVFSAILYLMFLFFIKTLISWFTYSTLFCLY